VLLDKALEKMVELTGSCTGAVYLHDAASGTLFPAASYGVSAEELKKLGVGEGFAGKCASGKKNVIIENTDATVLSLETGFFRVRPKGLAWFAMNYNGKLSGVFAMGSLKPYCADEISASRACIQIAIALTTRLCTGRSKTSPRGPAYRHIQPQALLQPLRERVLGGPEVATTWRC
jgi:hypothetical protein